MRIISKIIILTSVLAITVYAQSDWQRWNAKEISYLIPVKEKNSSSINDSSLGGFILSNARNAYKFFISDLDGDNCPFNPTCSSFFISAVKQTNIFQGSLMFADRFTRDLNLFKVKSMYPLTKDYHFYDPVNNYTLHPGKIKMIPATADVNE